MENRPPGQRDDAVPIRTVSGPSDGDASDPERVFWRRFAEARTAQAFCQSWLPIQCRMLRGVRCAMVLLGPAESGPFTPVAVWPDAKLDLHHLTGAAERSLKERRGLLVDPPDPGGGQPPFPEAYHIAYPIEVSGKLHGVVVLGVDHSGRDQVQSIMRQLHWGAAWLEVLIRRSEADTASQTNDQLRQVIDLTASVAEHDRFKVSAMGLVTRIATDLACDRVALGLVSGRRMRIQVLSHSADFGKQTNLVRDIEAAMDEVVDQASTVVYPPRDDREPMVVRAHADLSRQQGAGAICTVPIEVGGTPVGALTLERPEDNPFPPETVAVIESVAALTGPLLVARRAEERWLIQKAGASFMVQLQRLFGRRHPLRKLVAATLLVLVIALFVVRVDHRVSAPTVIEGEVQRVIAAPFAGYVREAPARPGDLVTAGSLLCLLDDRDLLLEQIRWRTQREQHRKEYQAALAKHDRAQIRILRAKIDQADAQLSLISEQLARTRVTAPFDGVVMSGDLSQSLGAPVERGQVLFEVAPLDAYRVIAKVNEEDIGFVQVGQGSQLMLPSMPGDIFPFTVTLLTPMSEAKEGRNYFRVEGALTKPSTRLRPGMEGIGKITVGKRRLIWVWTHKAMDWLRLQIWRYSP